MKEIYFLLVQKSLAYKLSITSSNSETAEGAYLFKTKFNLKSVASLAAPGGPILTKKLNGRLTLATDDLNIDY